MKKHMIAMLLMAMLLTQNLVSCGSTETNVEETTPNVTDSVETQAETETTWLDTLPEGLRYDGENFHIAWSSPVDVNECAIALDEITGGDIVSEAVYNRNMLVEEKLGITFSAERLCGWTDILTNVRVLEESGSNPYDAYCISVWFAYQSSINGYLAELGNVKTLDVSNSWWDPVATEMHKLGSKSLYFINGDINYVDDYGTSCVFFNKDMATDYQVPNLYDMVREGKWTYDALYEITSQVSVDVDGDGKYTEKDIYGFSDNAAALNRLLGSAGENFIVIDDAGNASINTSERIQNIVAKVAEELCGKQTVSTAVRGRNGFPDSHDLFIGSQCLLYPGQVSFINTYRDSMEADFGIIPSPKFDEAQEKYYSLYSTAWSSAYCLPNSNTELDKTGYILDVMGYYSHDTVYEAVIEKNVLTKAVRDEDSAEMLDIVFNSRFFELGQWGTGPYAKLNAIVISGTNNYASMAQSAQASTAKEFEKIKEYYEY